MVSAQVRELAPKALISLDVNGVGPRDRLGDGIIDDCLGLVDVLHADGYSVRRLLHALVPWLLEPADDKACALAPMLSRMERQALAMVDNRTLLHELVVGVNGVKR